LLQHPTIDRLRELGLEGMAKSLLDLTAKPESNALDHVEWLGASIHSTLDELSRSVPDIKAQPPQKAALSAYIRRMFPAVRG
jgi:hypothetical protein